MKMHLSPVLYILRALACALACAYACEGCIGPPKGVTVTGGKHYGTFENPAGREWSDDTYSAEVSLHFPITYGRREEPRPVYITAPPETPIQYQDPAAKPDDPEAPWWTDVGTVQMMVYALGGAAAAVGAKPAAKVTAKATRECADRVKTYVQNRRSPS